MGEAYKPPSASLSPALQAFLKSYDSLMVLDGIEGFSFTSIVKNSGCVIFHWSGRIGKGVMPHGLSHLNQQS